MKNEPYLYTGFWEVNVFHQRLSSKPTLYIPIDYPCYFVRASETISTFKGTCLIYHEGHEIPEPLLYELFYAIFLCYLSHSWTLHLECTLSILHAAGFWCTWCNAAISITQISCFLEMLNMREILFGLISPACVWNRSKTSIDASWLS